MFIESKGIKIGFSEDFRKITSLVLGNEERIGETLPLFFLRLRDAKGNPVILNGGDAKISASDVVSTEKRLTLTYHFEPLDVVVSVSGGERIEWGLKVENHSPLAVEYVDFPNISVGGKLRRNGGDGAIVSSYNEGLYVDDASMKRDMAAPEYPSQGWYMMFPYMLSSQFMLYLAGDHGLYIGVHDTKRAPKGLDFACGDNSTLFRIRDFVGGEYGSDIALPPIAWEYFDGGWQDGAEIYRGWMNPTLGIKPLAELDVPDWYKSDMPLVITYPVRGIHDMDEMKPNKLFPYENVLPIVRELEERTKSRIMVLLMHWEGTAPWAPPYVWPPYGGAESFLEFMRKLHERGDLLGVYCSGLGFTEQSNLIDSYNMVESVLRNQFDLGFCRAPDQSLPHSRICTGQRVGYDVCPASRVGKKLLDDALEPLLKSGVDYVQALDQNHGGGMYFCYAKDHGHPPVPGGWMTKASAELLRGWKSICPETLLGCESAAAEPYIDSLRLSDNRYELCYRHGKAIPLYSFLYHPYLKNFMGNQVSCPLDYTTGLLEYRLAYSFAAGDLLTLVLNDDGEVMFHWGMRDFSKTPDRDEIIGFVAKLQEFHKRYPAVFRGAGMVKPKAFECDEIVLEKLGGGVPSYDSAVLSTAWRVGEKTIQIFVNWTKEERICRFENGTELRLSPLSAGAMEFDCEVCLTPIE